MTKEAILNKFFKENPDFPKNHVNVFPYVKGDEVKDFYVFLCNEPSESGVLSKKEIKDFLAFAQTKGNAVDAFCTMFAKNNDAIESITDLMLKKFSNDLSAQEIAQHFSKSKKQTSKLETTLDKSNTITAHKVLEDGSLEEDAAFKMSFDVEAVKTERQIKKRCFVEEAESFDQGKGLYKHALTKLLPSLCEAEQISGIVLNASAFDVSSENNTQNKLEAFYQNQGFTKVGENEMSDFGLVCPSDFKDNLPVYYKSISMEQTYEMGY